MEVHYNKIILDIYISKMINKINIIIFMLNHNGIKIGKINIKKNNNK